MKSPEWHYQEADRLLASIPDGEVGLPFARARVEKAHAHAVLAQCPDWYGEFGGDQHSARWDPPGEVVAKVTGDRL